MTGLYTPLLLAAILLCADKSNLLLKLAIFFSPRTLAGARLASGYIAVKGKDSLALQCYILFLSSRGGAFILSGRSSLPRCEQLL